MAPRKRTERDIARLPAEENTQPEPSDEAGLVLADNVHFKGQVFLKGQAVSQLPEALKAHVVRNPELGVQPE
jgi:hypothetical protein